MRKAAICALILLAASAAEAKDAPPAAPADPAAALIGTWVSLITEDWRYRMVTPARGEYAGIPITPEAKRVADGWDPAKDAAAGEQCRAWGAAGLMRMPGRIRISREGALAIKVEMDNGTQTRLLSLAPPPPGPATWQGRSAAAWQDGTLKVVTTAMRPGYLRANGVPYGDRAELTEFWDVHREADGTMLLVITSLVTDPVYLHAPYGFSPIFRKEPDGSKWSATPCAVP